MSLTPHLLELNILFKRIFTLLRLHEFLNLSFKLLIIMMLLGCLVIVVVSDRGDSQLHILLKVSSLNELPLLSEVSDSPLHEVHLFLCELTILAECVQAHNKLDCLCLEGLRLDLLPLATADVL